MRLFIRLSAVFEWMLDDVTCDEERRHEKFHASMLASVDGKEVLASMRKFDSVYFPILDRGHYYLLVFELKNQYIALVYNASENYFVSLGDSENFFHKDTPYKFKDLFVKYLYHVGHPKAGFMDQLRIEKVAVEWVTTGNITDCGVFLMRHMKKYMGRHVPFTGVFSQYGHKKLGEIRRMRKKYACKILLSDVNLMKDKVRAALGRR